LYFDWACTKALVPIKNTKPKTTNFFIPTFIEV
jgi:hypothetical protein